MNMKSLQRKLRYWQKRLRLQDWDIIIEYNPRLIDKDGQVNTQFSLKKAIITIGNPYEGGWEIDIDCIIVHELLHLHFDHLDLEGTDNLLLEAGIDAIARALINREEE